MAMPQRDDLIEEIKRTDLLLEGAIISFSAFYSRIFLCRTLHGHLALPKGLMPLPESDEGKLMDSVRKYRDAQREPSQLLMKRMKNGDYGLSGLRINDFWEAYNFKDPKRMIEASSASIGDFTGSEEYETALLKADEELSSIAMNEPPAKPSSALMPESISRELQLYKESGEIESLFCKCYLFSLALFDANPDMLTKVFSEIFSEDAPSCQKAFERIIRRRIKDSGVTIEKFSEMMYPESKSSSPRKALDVAFSDSARIIQPEFINRIAKIYYEDCFDSENKKEGLEEYISKLWNFVIQSSVCMDRMGERLYFDFRAEARKNYEEDLKCAESFYSDFSRNT